MELTCIVKLVLRSVFISICLTLSLTVSAGPATLDSLDHMIRDRSQYDAPGQESIRKSRIDYEKASNDNDRYNVLRGLYEAYRSYRIDSALIVARHRLDIARRLGIPSKIASASLNLAEGYTRTGAVDQAINILDTLNPAWLEDYHLKYRSSVYREALRQKANSAILPEEKEASLRRLRELTDSAIKDSPTTSRGYYTMMAEKLCDAGLYKEAVATVEEAISRFDFSQDPAMLYIIGDIYLKAGEKQRAMDCLAQSAILDISSGTKEYRSLISLASLLLEEGEVSRAFEYINCALEDAEFSHSNLRTAEIIKSMPVIDRAFHDAEHKVVIRTRIFLIAAGVMVIVLLILVAWYVKALRANRLMLATIESINRRLAEKNEALAKADSLKLHYVNILMKAYSEYISRLKAFRKNIYRCLNTGQHDKAYDMVKSNRIEDGDITAFQSLFDEAFLSMFPEFITRVGRLMKDNVTLKEPDRLTPELRIIALMKLGIVSTEEISKLLHYSNQTVYNLRSSIRSMLAVTWEEFEKELRQI